MRGLPATFALLAWVSAASLTAAGQTWTGRLSDNSCGASHQPRAAEAHLTDRQCTTECIRLRGKYVLVQEGGGVLAIANQDFAGLPFHAGQMARVTGELKGGAIVLSGLEPVEKPAGPSK